MAVTPCWQGHEEANATTCVIRKQRDENDGFFYFHSGWDPARGTWYSHAAWLSPLQLGLFGSALQSHSKLGLLGFQILTN